MATLPEPTRPAGRHASLFIFDDFLDYEASTIDPREAQDVFDREADAAREERDALRRAFRPVERFVTGLALASALSLLLWIAIGVIAAAFAGRL